MTHQLVGEGEVTSVLGARHVRGTRCLKSDWLKGTDWGKENGALFEFLPAREMPN